MCSKKRILNILIVDNAAMGYMQEQFGRFLTKNGHKIVWIMMCTNSKEKDEKIIASVKLINAPILKSKRKIAKMANYFFYKPLVSLFVYKTIKKYKIDIILVRNDVRTAFLSYIICKRCKIPFVYYLAYPKLESDLLSSRLGFKKVKLIRQIAAFFGIALRSWIIRRAEFVFVMSDFWAHQLIEISGIPKDKVKSLPAGFDAKIRIEKIDGIGIRKELGISDCPTIFYMGTLTPPRDTVFIVNTMKIVIKKVAKVKLILLYGKMNEKSLKKLKKQFVDNGIRKNVILIPPIHYKEVYKYIKASHVGISPIETNAIFNVSSPHKFVEMLGMGCPVVASDIPEQKYLLQKSGGGICVPYNSEDFANAIIYLLNNPEKAKKIGMIGRAILEKERSYDLLANQIEKIFYRLLNKKNKKFR